MKNTLQLKNSGSLINFMMGNNQIPPVVGKGATILMWSDRHAYEVTEFDPEKRTCTIQRYDPERVDNYGMSDSQHYKYEKLTEEIIHLVYRNGAWRSIHHHVVFTDEYMKAHEDEWLAKTLSDEMRAVIYEGEAYPQVLVNGITREKTTYSKVNIIFGVLNEHYDYSF